MARQCTKPKKPRNLTWFKEKMLLAEALESGVALDEEQMAFLAYNGDTVTTSQESQEIPNPAIFQIDNLDAFDSKCDEAPLASAVLIAKLCAYDSDVLLEVPTHDTYLDNHVINQKTENTVVQDTNSSTQQDATIMFVLEEMSNQVAKCNAMDKENKSVNESLIAELERYKEQVKIFEERQKFDLNDRENYIDSKMRDVIVKRNAKFADFEKEIQSLKLHLSAHMSDNKLLTTIDVLKKETKEKEDKYFDEIIDLEKKKKDQTIVKKHDALFVPDSEETL
ncbi:hypothetical protein Tco_1370690 [Tanacetum coccineum]